MCAAGSVLQHGKDFEAIQNNIALKYRKKGRPAGMVKNKEQVRHFYYRTWHKITKYIDFDNGKRRLPTSPWPRAHPAHCLGCPWLSMPAGRRPCSWWLG